MSPQVAKISDLSVWLYQQVCHFYFELIVIFREALFYHPESYVCTIRKGATYFRICEHGTSLLVAVELTWSVHRFDLQISLLLLHFIHSFGSIAPQCEKFSIEKNPMVRRCVFPILLFNPFTLENLTRKNPTVPGNIRRYHSFKFLVTPAVPSPFYSDEAKFTGLATTSIRIAKLKRPSALLILVLSSSFDTIKWE